jgi:dipeptidyl aminopeptidase/acylaminoacyl peptidase
VGDCVVKKTKSWILALTVLAGLVTERCLLGQEHAFGVKDAIAMNRFSDLSETGSGADALSSPDGKYFAVVTSKGDLQTNTIESALSIFKASDVLGKLNQTTADRFQIRRVVCRLRSIPQGPVSVSYNPVISSLRWSSDSQELYFLGTISNGVHRLYRASPEGRETRSVTPASFDVRYFDLARNSVIFTRWLSLSTQSKVSPSRRMSESVGAYSVTGRTIDEILFPHWGPAVYRTELWRAQSRKFGFHLELISRFSSPTCDFWPELLSVSPQGEFAVALLPVRKILKQWESYVPAHRGNEARWLRIHADDNRMTSPRYVKALKQYALINLKKRSVEALIDAPEADPLGYPEAVKAAWSTDGQQVLVTNTFLPLNNTGGTEASERLLPCMAVSVQVRTARLDCVAFAADDFVRGAPQRVLEDASYGEDRDEVRLRFSSPLGSSILETYHLQSGRWRRASAASELLPRPAMNIALRQSLSEPPTLWATDTRSKKSVMLWNPNPQFAQIKFGEVSRFNWKDDAGNAWQGELIKPPGCRPGERHPLVIQVYDYAEGKFFPDQIFPTAMAARPLSSAGIVVLQMRKRSSHSLNEQEASDHLRGMEAAVRSLAEVGLVDPARVGVVGFSWTCWYVEYALIKRPQLFSAAVIADGNDNSYMEYHLWGATNPLLRYQIEAINGGAPVGDNLMNWLYSAPGFQLDHVVTPLQIEAIGPSSVLLEWELYSSLQLQSKPVDLIYFPEGEHLLQKPLERLASEQGSVDWFRFWLEGFEDPDPKKAGQYKRWKDQGSRHQ